jgi:hypothetical protein
VPLTLSPLAVVEDPGGGRTTQASERRLVEDPFEDLVAFSKHPAVVTYPLAGIPGRRDEPRVGGELVSTRKGSEVSDSHEELGTEDQTHAGGQASEDPGLGACEKPVPKFLIEGEEMRSLRSSTSSASSTIDTSSDVLAG